MIVLINAPLRALKMLRLFFESKGNKTKIGITAKSCINKIENDKRPTRVDFSAFSVITCMTIAVEDIDKALPIMIEVSFDILKKNLQIKKIIKDVSTT